LTSESELPEDRVIVALDVSSASEAHRIVESLGDDCGFYKVGPMLFYREGPAIVEWLKSAGKSVFLDLKAHDIPSVVESATKAAIDMGATFFTAHVAGGSAAAAAKAAAGLGERFFVLGVTVLTSSDTSAVEAEWPGVSLDELLAHRTRLAVEAGCDGVIAGVSDLEVISPLLPHGAIKVCPGIRMSSAGTNTGGGLQTAEEPTRPFRLGASRTDDQSRTATPAEAAAAGADFIVVGRPVLASDDPLGSLKQIAEEFLGGSRSEFSGDLAT
jgi:orotidine-5'-phosphate decarboxylase